MVSYGQQASSIQPLILIIKDIESRFDYKFTFANDIIEGVELISPPNSISFEDTLKYLEEHTQLTFTIINNTFVSINERDTPISICGIIKDIGTNTIIEGAEVIGAKTTTVSDELGSFKIEIIENDEIILINHLGYQDYKFSANEMIDGGCLEIFLSPQTFDLQEVVLKNYITKGIGKTSDGKLIIDYTNFGSLPGLIEADVLQTIQALPGVYSIDETVSNINVRGGTHDQNRILWDGIRMYQSGHFFGLISVFNPNITAKAFLVKNGTSSEYSEAVSGTIVMNSKDTVSDKPSFGIGINLINIDAFADIPIGKKSSLQISARKSINDILEQTPTYSRYFDRISQDSELTSNEQNVSNSDFEFDFYDTNLRWNYDISKKDKLRLNFLLINNDLIFRENVLINERQNSRQSGISQNSIAGGLWYQRKWNARFKTSLQIYETDYELQANNVDLLQSQRFLQKNRVSETGIKLKSNYIVDQDFSVVNGYQFIETGITNLNDIDSPIFVEQEVRVNRSHSIFSEIRYTPTNKSKVLHLGLRYSFLDKFRKHIVEPRLSYNQKLTEYMNLEVLGELKHQTTTQIINFQNDFLGIEKRRWFLSDENEIPIIRSGQVSLGLQYSRSRWLVTAEAFYKKVKNITARSQGFQNKFEFKKGIGDYTVGGLDILVNKRFTTLSVWLGYSLARNQYTFNTFEDKEFPNNTDIAHALTLGGIYTFNKFKLSAGINWHSGLPTTRAVSLEPVLNNTIDFGKANSDRLKTYFRFDISGVYDFNLNEDIHVHTGISVWNVTNNNNIIGNSYRLNQENIPVEMMKSALEITPNAVFRISF